MKQVVGLVIVISREEVTMVDLSEIEDGIAANEVTAAQVFTKLRYRITQLEAELLRVYQDKEDIRDKLVEVVNEHGIMVEALEEISNDWVEVNRVGMSHIAAKALAQVKGANNAAHKDQKG